MSSPEYEPLVRFLGPRFEPIDRRLETIDRRFDMADRRLEQRLRSSQSTFPVAAGQAGALPR